LFTNSIDTLINIFKEEFKRIDKSFVPLQISHSLDVTRHNLVHIFITFECDAETFLYITSLVTKAQPQRRYKHKNLSSLCTDTLDRESCGIYDFTHTHDVETIYMCEMGFSIKGNLSENSLKDMVNQFRECVKPLYEAVESKRFDEEVDKVLTEDDYVDKRN